MRIGWNNLYIVPNLDKDDGKSEPGMCVEKHANRVFYCQKITPIFTQ